MTAKERQGIRSGQQTRGRRGFIREPSTASAVAVERAADVLFLLAEYGESSVTDLSRAIGSSASAIHRILVALKRKGLVEQRLNTEGYALSWSVLALGRSLNERADLRTFALPFMTQLRDLMGESVSLNVRVGFERICVEQVESLNEVRWVARIGVPYPLYAGATGRLFLGYMSDQELTDYLGTVTLQPLTSHTVVTPDQVRTELSRIRAVGYAISLQDRIPGLAGVSAPIFDRSGSVIAALTIGGRADRLTGNTLKKWAPSLIQAALKITELSGGRSRSETDS